MSRTGQAGAAETDQVFRIRVTTSMGDIAAADWNALLGDDPNPFVRHEFLSALEESGSATAETGWLGQHLVLEDECGGPLAALPCYLKNHSQGEYVFDHGWADAFERAGGRYYPKLQCSVPFTPATGPRFLEVEGEKCHARRSALAAGLKQLTEKLSVSSAHITFLPQADWQALEADGFLLRTDQQFHWTNEGFTDFDDFLANLSSRKRRNIRKERAIALGDAGITVDWVGGNEMTEALWDQFFAFYMDTGSRKWGQPYLTREFYSLIGQSMPDQTVVMMANRAGRPIAGAINFVGDGCLYGRHWGCIEDHRFLHFELCYYQAIDYAIAHGLKRVEAGAQGGHKLSRGYLPVTTHSAHWIAHPGLRRAIDDYLQHERRHVAMENEALAAHTPFRRS